MSLIQEHDLARLVENAYGETDFFRILGKDLESQASVTSLVGWLAIVMFVVFSLLFLLLTIFQPPSLLTSILSLVILPIAYVIRWFNLHLLKKDLTRFRRIVANKSGDGDQAWTLFHSSIKLMVPNQIDVYDLKYYIEVKEEKQNRYGDKINIFYAFSISVLTVPLCLQFFEKLIDDVAFSWLFLLSLLVPSGLYAFSTIINWKKIRTQNIVNWVKRSVADLERNPTRY